VVGCGGSPTSNLATIPPNQNGTADPTAPPPEPKSGDLSASDGTALVNSIATKLVAGGINCPGFKPTGLDPGAIAQGTCGFPNVIEIAAFPRPSVVTTQFAPFLSGDFCGSTLTSLYVNGGSYAVYTTDDAVTRQIASVLYLPATKLC